MKYSKLSLSFFSINYNVNDEISDVRFSYLNNCNFSVMELFELLKAFHEKLLILFSNLRV
jgi:hypothetical protein